MTSTNNLPDGWRELPGWEGYSISEAGIIWRFGRALKPISTKTGPYVRTTGLPARYRPMAHDTSKRQARISVARLVCYAFHGEPSTPLDKVGYRNGDPLDCSADNVFWYYVTPKSGAERTKRWRDKHGD